MGKQARLKQQRREAGQNEAGRKPSSLKKWILPTLISVAVGGYFLKNYLGNTPKAKTEIDLNQYVDSVKTCNAEGHDRTLHLILQDHPNNFNFVSEEHKRAGTENVPIVQKNVYRTLEYLHLHEKVKSIALEGLKLHKLVTYEPEVAKKLTSLQSDDATLQRLFAESSSNAGVVFGFSYSDAKVGGWEDAKLFERNKAVTKSWYESITSHIAAGKGEEEVDIYTEALGNIVSRNNEKRSGICVSNSLVYADSLFNAKAVDNGDVASVIGEGHYAEIWQMFATQENRQKYGLEHVQLKVYFPKNLGPLQGK